MTAAIPLLGWIGLGVLYLVLFTVVAAICHAAHTGDQQIQDALRAHRWTWNAQPPEFDFPAFSSSAAGIKPRAPIVGGARGTSSSTTPEDK